MTVIAPDLSISIGHRGHGRRRGPKVGLSSNYLPEEREFRERIRSLSDGHLEVLALTALGYLNKQIAWVRGSSEATVKSQQKEILRRLGLRSRTQAAVQFAIYCERLRVSMGPESPIEKADRDLLCPSFA